MNKGQEEKLNDAYRKRNFNFLTSISSLNYWKEAWQACLEANKIESTEQAFATDAERDDWIRLHVEPSLSSRSKPSAVPPWVMEMFRTGKPVRCTVWDDPNVGHDRLVNGYHKGASHPFMTEGVASRGYWKHAEPIPVPKWVPKEGEPCLFCDDDGRGMAGFIYNGHLYARGLMWADWKKNPSDVKPFDPAKIGLPWDQI